MRFKLTDMYDVIAIGSATRDFFLKSKLFKVVKDKDFVTGEAQCFAFGTKVEIDDLFVANGGGASNCAVTFARQGLKTAYVGKIGDDHSGKIILDSFKKEGIDISLVKKVTGVRTATSFILLTEEGEKTILNYNGASGTWKEEELPFDLLSKSKYKPRWFLISSLRGNLDLCVKLIAFAKTNDIKVATLPGQAELKHGPKSLAPILAGSDVFVLNRQEASQLTGISFESSNQITHSLCLLTRGIGVVTDGENGATVCDARNFYRVEAQKVKVLDTTGAGDAFASGFITGLICNQSIEKALQLAVNNSASVVSQIGAQTGILGKNQNPFKDKSTIEVKSIV